MIKTVSAGLLSLTLVLTAVAPTPVRAGISDEEAVAGLLALLFLGAAISRSNNRPDPVPEVQQPQPPQPDRGAQHWRVLPTECRVVVNTYGGGEVRMFGRRCLRNNYDHMHRLPARCEISVQSRRGNMRHGFAPRCLRRAGFETGGRRH